MQVRIIQWNISLRSKANEIANFLGANIYGPTIVNLQEVIETTYKKLVSQLNPDATAFSLDLRKPGKFKGKNRKLGVATFVFKGGITATE